jgi:hypothetical protein
MSFKILEHIYFINNMEETINMVMLFGVRELCRFNLSFKIVDVPVKNEMFGNLYLTHIFQKQT